MHKVIIGALFCTVFLLPNTGFAKDDIRGFRIGMTLDQVLGKSGCSMFSGYRTDFDSNPAAWPRAVCGEKDWPNGDMMVISFTPKLAGFLAYEINLNFISEKDLGHLAQDVSKQFDLAGEKHGEGSEYYTWSLDNGTVLKLYYREYDGYDTYLAATSGWNLQLSNSGLERKGQNATDNYDKEQKDKTNNAPGPVF